MRRPQRRERGRPGKSHGAPRSREATRCDAFPTTIGGHHEDIQVSGATNILVDVFGPFTRPQATALDCVDTTKVSGTIAAGAKNLRLTSNICPTGYAIVSGSCFGGNDSNYYLQESTKTASSAWLCNWESYNTVDAESLAVSSTCCRVPGR